jgi:hypothetical protein
MQQHDKLMYYYCYDKINSDGNLYYDNQIRIIVLIRCLLVFLLLVMEIYMLVV